MGHRLCATISDDPEMEEALFPAKGANRATSKGGGKSKTEYHFLLVERICKDHPKYKDAFALAKTPAQKRVWGNKAKNALKRHVVLFCTPR